MLRRWIQALRHKPKSVRDNIALGIAASFTAAVFGFWFFLSPGKEVLVINDNNNQPGLFTTIIDQFKKQTAAIGESVDSVREAVDEIEELPEEQSLQSFVDQAASSSRSTATPADTDSGTESTETMIKISTTTSAEE